MGDAPPDILAVLRRAEARSEFVIVCGGLGPTEDDITARVAADFYGRPLVADESFRDMVRRSLERRGWPGRTDTTRWPFCPGARGSSIRMGRPAVLSAGERVPFFFCPACRRRCGFWRKARFALAGGSWGRAAGGPAEGLQGLWSGGSPDRRPAGRPADGGTGAGIGFYPNFPENHVLLTVRAASADRADGVLSRLGAEVEKRLGLHVVARDDSTLVSGSRASAEGKGTAHGRGRILHRRAGQPPRHLGVRQLGLFRTRLGGVTATGPRRSCWRCRRTSWPFMARSARKRPR